MTLTRLARSEAADSNEGRNAKAAFISSRVQTLPHCGQLVRAKGLKERPLLFPCNRSWLRTGLLVPSVETREITSIPCLAESRFAQIPVWPDFTRHGAQVVPKIDDRWTPPEPVAVIDAVNHKARLEHERMRDHRIVLGGGVLLDVEILLNGSIGVRKECPLGSD